ncbi:extra-large G-protein 1 [Wolffia australiana]
MKIRAAMEEDCSFAEEYDGPPISYEIPRAIPIEMDRIPVASMAAAPKLISLCVPVVQPLPSAEIIKRQSSEGTEFCRVVVSPTSVIGFDQTAAERPDCDVSGDMGSTSSGALDCSPGVHDVGSHSVDQSATRSGGEFASACPDVRRERPASRFEEIEVESRGSVHHERGEGSNQRVKKGACYRCQRGSRFTEKEACLVCDSKFCSSCLLKAMGSMPEGRKCVTCIGLPIDDRKRENLGKCSRMLRKLLSPLELEQVLKAEKFSEANHFRAENVFVNGCQLSQEEMILLQTAPNPPSKLKPGRYWYDRVSGFWGKEGHKPQKIITPNLNVGGSLMTDASNGMTGVYINNREITKPELRMLQWAGVQCAGCPHFWLNADGSYQEEGQRNIRGNLWDKAGMKLVCSVLSLPTPCKEIVISGEEVNSVANGNVPDYFQPKASQKLLLIGYSQSGSSTIFKQAKLLYQPVPFSDEERGSIKILIQANIYKYLGILLEGRERFEAESLREMKENQDQQSSGVDSDRSKLRTPYSIGPRLKSFSDWLLKVIESGNLEAIFPAATREYSPLVEELWKDPAIQISYERRNELPKLPSSASYFLERVVDISRAEYEPSQLDILHADGITSSNGLTSTDFVFPHSPGSSSEFDGDDHNEAWVRYQLIRVNAKGLGENYKWLEMFDDIRLVVFCVALTDYDELMEDSAGVTQNKMLESRRLFESIVSHPTMEHVEFLLVLTKLDLLDEKLVVSPLTACDWFADYHPFASHHRRVSNGRHVSHSASPPLQAFHYIAAKFKQLFSSLTDGRKLYVTTGNGLDPESTDRALRYAREVLKWEDERLLYSAAGADDDAEGAYSTDPGSPLE